MSRDVGRPLAWTDEKLKGTIEILLKKHGRVTPGLLASDIRGAYDAIFRRVKKGEFKSMQEAIDKIGANGSTETTEPKTDKANKIKICLGCNRKYEKLPYRDRKTKQNICSACYQKDRRKQGSKSSSIEVISQPGREISPIVPVSSIHAELVTPQPSTVYRPIPMEVTEPEKEEEVVSQSDCCSVVDIANNRDPKDIRRLDEMIEQEPEKVRRLLKEIFRPSYPAAQAIVRRFLETAEGEKLKSFITQNPDLSRKVGVSH